jgi:hypothetical protein
MNDYISLLESVPTFTAAIERCYLIAGKSAKEAAWDMGIEYSHFRRMLRDGDPQNYPPDKIELLMKKMGNTFPLDWLAHRMGYICYPKEFMEILEGIKDSLRNEGREIRFSLSGE